MDEATSALDTETERNIRDNIDRLHGKYTIIIVAHRLSTIKNADRIILMNKGSILTTGNFQTLSTHPVFSAMISMQEL
jgi:subfamily B ATP-binding cassette protein MsbA